MYSGSTRQRAEGFSLIELMIATSIFLLGGVSVIALLVYALAANYRAKVEFAAVHLSEQKIEELKSLPFQDTRLAIPGCPVDANGELDFAGSPAYTHSATRLVILQASRNSTVQFETRWNVSLVADKKVITVATQASGLSAQVRPMNLKIVRAQ